MDEDFNALQRQQTWIIVPPHPTQNLEDYKWVFKVKHPIARHKARLVAKGFHQQDGVEFDETFITVIKPPTIRITLSLAVTYN